MTRHTLIGLLFALLLNAGGLAADSREADKPVWTIEILTVKPGMFGLTLGYLDDNWMSIRAEAQRQGVVLARHRIAEQNDEARGRTIVLLTEYKSRVAYENRKESFSSIREQLNDGSSSGILHPYRQAELFETSGERMFQDWSDGGAPRNRPALR